MDEYFIGIVKEHQKEKIVFETNNHGYILNGVNLNNLNINEILKLYIYFLNKPGKEEYFAFLDQETKNYFLELISISHIGPKTALKILNSVNITDLKEAIAFQNFKVLQQCKGVTRKLAYAIIDHFNKKSKIPMTNHDYQQKWALIFETLLKLGFNKNNINNYLLNVDWTKNIDNIVSDAVKELHSEYY